MRIAYPAAYLEGSGALGVLALGIVCFALFVISATIMSGAGRPGIAAAIACGAVVVVVVGNLVLVRLAGVGDKTLLAAATGTSLGAACAFVAMAIALYRRFGALIAPLSALRTLAAAAVGFTVAHLVPSHSFLLAATALCAGGLAYIAALIALRELGANELAVIGKVIRPRAKNK